MIDARPPWQHQKDGVTLALARRLEGWPCFAYLFDPGTGKSRTTVDLLRQIFNEQKRLGRTLIFAPPIVVKNWKNEWAMYSKVEQDNIILLRGSGKKRLETLRKHCFTPEGKSLGKIVVTNYESLLMPDLLKELQKWSPEVLVLDELHRLKNPTAKKSKLMSTLCNPHLAKGSKVKEPYKIGLTGTPILKDAMDLFMQFYLLDGGRTFGSSFFAFRARYFRDRNAGMPKERYFPNWQPMTLERDGVDAMKLIQEKISPISMRVKKEDCLDLPPLVRTVLKVGMTPDQKRIYEEMKRDFVAYLKSGEAVVATLAMTKALRLQQIASGYAKTMEGNVVEIEETPKMEALRELLEDITPASKVLVWAVFEHNYAQVRAVCERLGVRYVEVHGLVSDSAKQQAVASFSTDPAVRVLIGHPRSGGIGINLVAASHSIFYSRGFSLEDDLQAEARNYRGGSEVHACITRTDLVCEGTIDELVLERLANKQEVSNSVLSGLAHDLEKETAIYD